MPTSRDSQAGLRCWPRPCPAPTLKLRGRLSRKPEPDVTMGRTGSRCPSWGTEGRGHKFTALVESRHPALLSDPSTLQSAVWTPWWRGFSRWRRGWCVSGPSQWPLPVALGIAGWQGGRWGTSLWGEGVGGVGLLFFNPFSASPGHSCLSEISGGDRLIPLPHTFPPPYPTPPKTTNLSYSK